MEDARDVKLAPAESHHISDRNVLRARVGVADQRFGALRARPVGDHEAPSRKLVRIESEHEPLVRHVEVDPPDLCDTRLPRHLRRERGRQARQRQIRSARLEEPEVGAADVDQLVGRRLRARGNRK